MTNLPSFKTITHQKGGGTKPSFLSNLFLFFIVFFSFPQLSSPVFASEEAQDLLEPVPVEEQVYRFDQVTSRLVEEEGEVLGITNLAKQAKPMLSKVAMPLWEKLGLGWLGLVAVLTILVWLFFYFRHRYESHKWRKIELGEHPQHKYFFEIRYHLWLLRHLPLRLQPNFARDHPHKPYTLKDNLLILIFHPVFKALRYAVLLWLIFSLTVGGLGIYSLQHAVKLLAASPVTDTFTDTSKIATSTNMTVSGGQLKLSVVPWSCGDTLTDSRDSKTYATVLIGSQCWMKQNINIGTRIAGTSNQTDNATIEKYCYSDTDANCDTTNNPNYPDGGLYQWDEAMQYAASCNGTGAPPDDACATPVQGICPSGWHIPSHYELTTLERAVCTSGTCATDFPYDTTTTDWRGTDEGTKLKPNGSSGFEGNFAGYRKTDGSFSNRGAGASVWSSLESGSNAWSRDLGSGDAAVSRNAFSRLYGFSVRCVQD